MNRWDKYFHDICVTISTLSRCHSRQIGVVIARDHRIVSTGYNGPPEKARHCEGECARRKLGFPSGKGLQLCPAVHAETNAIVNAARLGVATVDTTMYMSCGIPCKECMKLIINAGIVEVVCTSLEIYDVERIPLHDDFLRIVHTRTFEL